MKPTALTVKLEGIPLALRREPRWACWRSFWQLHDGKTTGRWSKLPCQTNGLPAKTNDRTTWTSFDHAYEARARFDGIGFMLGNGWAGIDLDDMLSGPIVDRIPCYIERSPGGKGLKAIGRSSRMGGEIKPMGNTTWQGPRFFATTGQGSYGDPTVDITYLLNEWFPPRTTAAVLGDKPAWVREGDVRGVEAFAAERMTDDQVVQRILVSAQADKFIRLAKGDMTEYGDDHSRADQALCCILAYWCGNDLDQIDRLFRDSGLMREKWNATSYRRATLLKAVQQ